MGKEDEVPVRGEENRIEEKRRGEQRRAKESRREEKQESRGEERREEKRREKKRRGQNDTVRVLLIVLPKVVVVGRNGVNYVFTKRRRCSGSRSRTSDASDEGSGFH